MTKPRIPPVSASSPDEDPTGVRALLSSLPSPDPMPEHLVERINASLAAEQAQRAAGVSGDSVIPLLATRQRRRGRLVFAMAGAAAAAVALVTVVGNSLVGTDSTSTSAERLTATSTSNPRGPAAQSAAPGAKPLGPVAARPGAASGPELNSKDSAAAAPAPTGATRAASGAVASEGSLVDIRQSGTRYTQSEFVKQARTLSGVRYQLSRPKPGGLTRVGPAGTASGLTACLKALGAGGAQQVWADVASYDGHPAVIIVATTKGVPIAYAVGPQCSKADTKVLRPATPLR